MNQRKVGAALSYVTIGLQNIVGLLYTPYLLRMLGKSEFGLYSLVTSIIAYLTLLDFGFGNAVTRYTAKYKAEGNIEKQYSLFGMFTIVYIIIAVIASVLGITLSLNIDVFFETSMTQEEISRAQIMMFLLVGNLALTFFFSIYKAILDAYEQFVFVRSLNVLRIIFNTLIMLILLQFGYKAIALTVLITILNFIILILNFIYCFSKLKIKVKFNGIEWFRLKAIGSYSFLIFLSGCIDNVYWTSGQFILGMYHGAKVIAVYAIAIQLVNMYRHFTSAIADVFFPKIVTLTIQKNSEKEVSDIFVKISRIQYLIISLILSGFIVFGKEFILLWAGNGYEMAYIVSLIFFVSLVPTQTQHLGLIICRARNHLKFRTYVHLLIAILSLLFQIACSKYFGMIGNALAISISLLLMGGVVLNIYYAKYESIDIPSYLINLAKLSFVPICISFTFVFIKGLFLFNSWHHLIGGIISFTFLFVILSYFFSLNSYEKKMLKNSFTRIKNLCQ